MGEHKCLCFMQPKLTRGVLQFHKKEWEQQIRRITVSFTPDSIVGIATRLWAGQFGVQIQAEARDFIFCKTSTLALGSIKLST